MKFPIDFEQKVKEPARIDGRQYPYQISAKHLMDNFRFAALQVDDDPSGDIFLSESKSASGQRKVSIGSNASLNDMLIYDGTDWVVFEPPSSSSGTFIHAYKNGHVWIETEDCV
jgi:hypothetical protein